MDKRLEALHKLRDTTYKLKDTLSYYQRLFEADGQVTPEEKKELKLMQAKITKIEKVIKKKSNELMFWDEEQNEDEAEYQDRQHNQHKYDDRRNGITHDDHHVDKPIKIANTDYSVAFIPNKIAIYNNGKVIHQEDIPLKGRQPRQISFSLDSCLDLNQYKIEFKVWGEKTKTKEAVATALIDFKLTEDDLSAEKLLCSVNLLWFGDGEKEFPILINGLASKEDSKEPYWESVADVIKGETGSSLSKNDSLYLDGDADGDAISANLFSKHRYKEGVKAAKLNADGLFSKLTCNEQGKIAQRIQIYAHSRGSTYANGFINQLTIEIEKRKDLFENYKNVIDVVIHADAHQSGTIEVKPGNHPTILVSHDGSILGGSDAVGDAFNIERNESFIGNPNDHRLATFNDDIEKVLSQHNENTLNGADKYNKLDTVFDDPDKARHALSKEERDRQYDELMGDDDDY